MVQYFAENLDGFAVTQNGWVQSYGSRCTRPSILWGDVVAPEADHGRLVAYAQSLTEKPVKGMLTGPVTILAWSFVRDDQPLGETANQVGARAARRDRRPRGRRHRRHPGRRARAARAAAAARRDHAAYLDWSVGSFRLATAGVRRRDADPHPPLLLGVRRDHRRDRRPGRRRDLDRGGALADGGPRRHRAAGYRARHRPGRLRHPLAARAHRATRSRSCSPRPSRPSPADQLWVNPDCGLKTRRYEEVAPSLEHILEATRKVRATL